MSIIKKIAVGKIESYKKDNGETFESGYLKKEITGNSVFVSENGIDGDQQADKRWHGGSDKAVMFFSEKHFGDFPDYFFGANIFISKLIEKNIMIGDIYKIGETEIEISQPRQPCWKVSFFGNKNALKYLVSSGYSGFYGRVLKSGIINLGDEVKLLKRVSDLSVFEATYLLKKFNNKNRINDVLNIVSLAESYKIDIRKNL
jgi:MOSC domain-containing protein YiiM